jgi:hypothetical protein
VSLVDKVLSGGLVVFGTWQGWKHLTNLVIDRAKPKMTRSERATQWQLLVTAIMAAVQGILFVNELDQ